MDELTALLHRAATGDRLALAGFIRASQADVWRFCAHLVDPGSADDLTQEVYVRAMRSMHRFRGDASARTWLLAVARHVAADEIRRRQRRRRYEPPTPAPDVQPAEVDAIAVQDLIDQLDPDRRAAFVLTQQLGFSYADAAATLDVPIGTVRSRVARGREQLLDALQRIEREAGPASGSDLGEQRS
jgi:RNA polymerase sigma-70 factor, ECF subfamily